MDFYRFDILIGQIIIDIYVDIAFEYIIFTCSDHTEYKLLYPRENLNFGTIKFISGRLKSLYDEPIIRAFYTCPGGIAPIKRFYREDYKYQWVYYHLYTKNEHRVFKWYLQASDLDGIRMEFFQIKKLKTCHRCKRNFQSLFDGSIVKHECVDRYSWK